MMTHALHRIAETRGKEPATVRAEMEKSNPQGRIVQPQEIAALIDFFCSDRAPGLTNADVQINAGADW